MLFALLFWVFDDMIFTAIEVFIDRNVNSHLFSIEIPASVLICANPITIMVLGVIISLVWQKAKPAASYKICYVQVLWGFILQFLSFAKVYGCSLHSLHK